MNTSPSRTAAALSVGGLFATLLLLGSTPSPGRLIPLAHAGRNPRDSHLVINEVQYDPPQTGTVEAAYEWFELYNAGNEPVALSGWTIADNSPGSDPLPDLAIPPSSFAVVAATASFSQNFAVPALFGTIADGRIGGGLSNDGDCLILRDPAGHTVDALSYGKDTSVFDPPIARVAPGHSLERIPAGLDTGTAADFIDQPNPSPGRAGTAPTPTPTQSPTTTATPPIGSTPTATITPTITPTAGPPGAVLINEVQYDPPQPGNDSAYEWVELYNNCPTAVDLAGWRLTDNVTDTLLVEARLQPQQFLVVAATDQFRANFPDFAGRVITATSGMVGNGLRNAGDRLLLRNPAGAVVDALSWGDDRTVFDPAAAVVDSGHSLERVPVGTDTGRAADFKEQWQPSPGRGVAEIASTPTPTPTPVRDKFVHLPIVVKAARG